MKPLIHQLLQNPVSGESIEARSMAIIARELGPWARQQRLTEGEWRVVRRLVHTTGDIDLAPQIAFCSDAIQAGVRALLAKSPIIADANMQRSGISLARLRSVCPAYTPEDLHCFIADADVAELAQKHGQARSLFAARKSKNLVSGAIVGIGNAPVALLEYNRMHAEESLSPALVLGFPVGFVHVEESKDELESLGIPAIVVRGRRGGSSLAVAALHALTEAAVLEIRGIDHSALAWSFGEDI